MTKSKKLALTFLFGIPLVCCLGGSLVFLVGGGFAGSNRERERAAARRDGMPMAFSDISFPTGPEAQNAAPIYRQAMSLVEGPLKADQAVVSKALGRTVSEDDRAEGDAVLAKMKPVLDLLGQLPNHSYCNFHRDWNLGPALMFPELADMRACFRDLVFKADNLDRDGDWRGALKSMSLAHRVSSDCGSDPILIGMLVGIAGRAIANAEYEVLISRHLQDKAFLDAAEAQIRSQCTLPDPRRFLGGEIAFGVSSIHQLKTLRTYSAMDSDDVTQAVKPSSIEASFFQSKLVQDTVEAKMLGAWRVGWERFPKDSQDWQGFNAAMKVMDEAVDKDNSLSNTVNKLLFPVFSQAMDAIGNVQAHDRLLLCSIGLLKLKLKTGRLPAATPSRFGDIRIDPFDGNPLRYRKSGSGFILYSIGRDRVDDGGHRRNSKDVMNAGVDEVVDFGD